MKTSYFARFKGTNGVSITLGIPIWFKGAHYPQLAPKADFLFKYKKDGDEKEYTNQYYAQVLDKLDPQEVYNDLKDKVLLCYEKSGKFCHRRLVADWIEEKLGIVVPEEGQEQEK